MLALVPLAYGWRVTTTLRETEQRIVVPLPVETVGPAAAAVAPSPTALATPTPASQVALVGAMIGAATADGDPGADPIWRGRRYLNVLVLGFDSRPGQQGPPRSDVFMIAQLDLVAKTLNVVSVPRDLWLNIPGFGDERINAAYPLGWRATQPAAGVALAKQTVERNFGIPIHYYMSIDFNGFKRTVDAVGGVTIDVPRYLRDDAYPTEDYGIETVEFFPGVQRMDGTRALKYARTRHADSDYGRRLRQEQLVLALLEAGQNAGIVARLPAVLRSFAGTVQTNFSFEEQLVLGRVALAMKRADVTLYSVDETMTKGWLTPGGADVILGDWALIEQLVARTFVTPTRSEQVRP